MIQALLHLKRDKLLTGDIEETPQLERTRSTDHGEFASNLALVLTKQAKMPPRDLAAVRTRMGVLESLAGGAVMGASMPSDWGTV